MCGLRTRGRVDAGRDVEMTESVSVVRDVAVCVCLVGPRLRRQQLSVRHQSRRPPTTTTQVLQVAHRLDNERTGTGRTNDRAGGGTGREKRSIMLLTPFILLGSKQQSTNSKESLGKPQVYSATGSNSCKDKDLFTKHIYLYPPARRSQLLDI